MYVPKRSTAIRFSWPFVQFDRNYTLGSSTSSVHAALRVASSRARLQETCVYINSPDNRAQKGEKHTCTIARGELRFLSMACDQSDSLVTFENLL